VVEFYSSIGKYYDSIFPFDQEQLAFVLKELTPHEGKDILDMGCATGSLAIELARAGCNVTAFDLDTGMVKEAVKKRDSLNLLQNPKFIERDIRHMKIFFEENSCDAALSFGNTIAHLTEEEDLEIFFSGLGYVVRPGGEFILQMLNYDYIKSRMLECLPLIDNEKIRFQRYYDFLYNGLIAFNTVLTVKGEEEMVINNSVRLNPLGLESVKCRLESEGFKITGVFENYKGESLSQKNLPLIITALKE